MITSPQTRDNFIMSDYTLKLHMVYFALLYSQKHNINHITAWKRHDVNRFNYMILH